MKLQGRARGQPVVDLARGEPMSTRRRADRASLIAVVVDGNVERRGWSWYSKDGLRTRRSIDLDWEMMYRR